MKCASKKSPVLIKIKMFLNVVAEQTSDEEIVGKRI